MNVTEDPVKKEPHWLRRKITSQFIEGILVIVPIGIAVWVLIWLFEIVDGFLQPVIKEIIKLTIPNAGFDTIPGAGFVMTLLLIYLVGLITENVIGRRVIRYGESQLARVPVFRYVYTGIKNLVTGFSMSGKSGGFNQVVLIEFPMKGMKTIGFVTGEIKSEDGEKLLTIYVPQAPTPTTGFIEIVREKDVVRLDMSIEDAIKMVVSAGAFSPPQFKACLSNQTDK